MLPKDGPIATFPPPLAHTFATVAGFQTWAQHLSIFETPITIRFTHLIDVLNWNCAAIYSSDWKDSLTKEDVFFHTPSSIALEEGNFTSIFSSTTSTRSEDGDDHYDSTVIISLHSSDTRLLCMVNAWATVVGDWIPQRI